MCGSRKVWGMRGKQLRILRKSLKAVGICLKSEMQNQNHLHSLDEDELHFHIIQYIMMEYL